MTNSEPTPLSEVKEQSPELKAALDAEQERLNVATIQAQSSYLTQRLTEVISENLELKEEIASLKKRKTTR